jgi:hypothetical protein
MTDPAWPWVAASPRRGPVPHLGSAQVGCRIVPETAVGELRALAVNALAAAEWLEASDA